MGRNTDRNDKILELYKNYILPTYPEPDIVFCRGRMARLYDSQGNEYLDFTSGIGVCNLGHCHPRVTEAIQRQASQLIHTSNLFANENQPKLARLLAEHTFGGKLFFCNSGAEANEGMIKLARKWGAPEERFEIITMEESFHGRTLATLAATGRDKYRAGFQPDVQGFVHVPFNDLDAVKQAVNDKTVAVLIEPIQGEGGVIPAQKDFLAGLRKLCNENKLLLLFDEVQCGMGRTGELFAALKYGVEPDVLAMAKALGNGFPTGAFEVQPEYADVLTPGTHASTFGGNPLAAAAGIAVVETMFDEKVLQDSKHKAALLWQGLEDLKDRHECIREVRGCGLMIGLQLDIAVKEVIGNCRERNLLVLPAGNNVLRLLPPLIIEENDIRQAVDTIDAVLP